MQLHLLHYMEPAKILEMTFSAFNAFTSTKEKHLLYSYSRLAYDMDAVEQVSTLSSMYPSRRSTLTSQQLALSGRRKSIGIKRDGKEFWEAHTTYRRGVTPDSLRPYTVQMFLCLFIQCYLSDSG